jgi:hypothetical protein
MIKRNTGPARLGLNKGGPGKGSANRTGNVAAYNANRAEIAFSGVPASSDRSFAHPGVGLSVKCYGNARNV